MLSDFSVRGPPPHQLCHIRCGNHCFRHCFRVSTLVIITIPSALLRSQQVNRDNLVKSYNSHQITAKSKSVYTGLQACVLLDQPITLALILVGSLQKDLDAVPPLCSSLALYVAGHLCCGTTLRCCLKNSVNETYVWQDLESECSKYFSY